MTSLSDKEINSKVSLSSIKLSEVTRYLKKHRKDSDIRNKIPRAGDVSAWRRFRKFLRRRIQAARVAVQPGVEVSHTYAADSRKIIYGRMRVGGTITFINSERLKPATMAVASPGVITSTAHGLAEGATTEISTTGALLTGMTAGNTYFVRNPTRNTFNISDTATGSLKNFSGTQSGSHKIVTGDNSQLDVIYTLAGHKISGIDEIWLDDELILFGASPDPRWAQFFYNPQRDQYRDAAHRFFFAYSDGTVGNAAIPELVARTDLWTSNHTQTGCAHGFAIFVADGILFPNGLPEATFTVRGKELYDFATTGTSYSANAARVIADFLMDTTYGLGVSLSDLETGVGAPGSFYDAQLLCEEGIPLLSGGTEPRYHINAAFSSEESPQQILEKMSTAIGGSISYVGGKWKIFPATWREPAIDLTDDDCLEPLEVQTKSSISDSFNGVKGTFTSPTKGYIEDDFPAYKNDFYQTLDSGKRLWEDVQFPCTTSATACQRLAKILVEQARQQIEVRGIFSLKAYQVEAGETVTITRTRFGWSQKPFEVVEVEPVVDSESENSRLAVRMILRETAESVFDWNNGEELSYDPAPNTNLGSPYDVQELQGLELFSGTDQLYITSDGTVVSRLLAQWRTATDGFVSSGGTIELEFKQSSAAAWNPAISFPPNTSNYYILDVQDGVEYDVRIRAKNGLGIYSEYTTVTNHLVLGKTSPPSNVTGISVSILSYGLLIGWSQIADLDVLQYEIRVGSEDDIYEEMQVLAVTAGNSFQSNIRAAGIYKFAVKAIDTSGNFSEVEAVSIVSISAPDLPVVTSEIVGPNLVLSWSAPESDFQIFDYVIKYGASFAGGTTVGSSQTLTYIERVLWSGDRTYWIAARDIAGNIGTATAIGVSIAPPSAVQNITAEIIDNNVLLRWESPASGSLPIDYYNVYKGETFAAAVLTGQVSATFSAVLETVAGTYTYWITAVDTANTESAENSYTAEVSQPPDYVLRSEQELPASGWDTATNVFRDGNLAIAPVNLTQTWNDHFTTNSWTDPDAQVTAGYPLYLQPSTTPATIEDKIDYGALLGATIVTVAWGEELLDGAVTVQCDIGYSVDDVSYTYVLNKTSELISSFRYIKARLTVTAAAADGLVIIRNLTVRLDVKYKTDQGGPVTAPTTNNAKTVTITIASPAVVTSAAHGLVEGQQIELTTTGALPTGLATLTIYFVRYLTANTYNLSATPQGALINTSGTQSGTHTATSRGVMVLFNRQFIDVEGLTVIPTPTPAQRGATLPLSPMVTFKDSPYNIGFNVEIYNRSGTRVACDFRWSVRGV